MVSLYFEDTIPAQHLDITVPDGLECLWMRTRPRRLPREVPCIIMAAIYNPPKISAEKKLLEHISQSMTELKVKYPGCGLVISGDFNKADMSNVRDRELVNVVLKPTRGQNTLGLIITNLRRFYQETFIPPTVGRSDHFTVIWKPTGQARYPPKNRIIHLQPITDSAVRSFGQWITSCNWRPVLEASTAQAKTDTFYSILTEQINRHFPRKKTKCTTSDKPWMTTKIKTLILKRQKALRGGKCSWRFYRNTVNRAIKASKRSFAASKLSEASTSNDPIAWYRTAKVLSGNRAIRRPVVVPGIENKTPLEATNDINALLCHCILPTSTGQRAGSSFPTRPLPGPCSDKE